MIRRILDWFRGRPTPPAPPTDRERRVLGAIAWAGRPLYGLEVAERAKLGGSIYMVLGSLERRGWVTAEERPVSGRVAEIRGGRPRVYYALTPSGRTAWEADAP